jgi:hypothetical protein
MKVGFGIWWEKQERKLFRNCIYRLCTPSKSQYCEWLVDLLVWSKRLYSSTVQQNERGLRNVISGENDAMVSFNIKGKLGTLYLFWID